jgi:hypothetical protein
VNYHVRLPLNKLNHEVWIARQNTINLRNEETKFGFTTPNIMNCIHNAFRVRLKNNMSNAIVHYKKNEELRHIDRGSLVTTVAAIFDLGLATF